MMNKNNLFLDIHAIQILPPSNVNRDDTGSPKTAQYGGVTRARVSSQAWKKAMRDYFNEHGENANVGVRTKNIVEYVASKIAEKSPDKTEEAIELAENTLKKAGISIKDHQVKALFFLGDAQANALAEAAIQGQADKKTLQQCLNENPSVDISLFGRMVADDPSLNEDASAQIAHAISTHAVQNEFDYFTALDDLSKEDNAGAGMLGTIEFNSSVLYRYGNVAIHELLKQLESKEATINAIKLFVEAFSNSLPTGKINTFANQTVPNALIISLRKDRPVNLVSAFEKPVRTQGGYLDKSIERLANEFKKVDKFVEEPLISMYINTNEDNALKDIGEEEDSLKNLTEDLGKKLEELL